MKYKVSFIYINNTRMIFYLAVMVDFLIPQTEDAIRERNAQ
ncbi:hypothetical protein PQ460_00270 [Paenibacillus sp. KACC 21273]|nr:hypothetical protein [Paenibacillus sp. KACC 21273]WDF50923.1 hypothetical protein PQ460_00270 [Paenibacillus sp. KACC 21273]